MEYCRSVLKVIHKLQSGVSLKQFRESKLVDDQPNVAWMRFEGLAQVLQKLLSDFVTERRVQEENRFNTRHPVIKNVRAFDSDRAATACPILEANRILFRYISEPGRYLQSEDFIESALRGEKQYSALAATYVDENPSRR